MSSEMAIVPNYVSDAINGKLDEKIAECPGAESDRAVLYEKLLDYFDEFGEIPDFTITKKEDANND